MGRLCADALVGTAYVQTGLQRRAFPERWRGLPSLTADSLDLGAAQRAWLEWLHDRKLVWPLPPGFVPPCPTGDAIKVERFRDSTSTDGSRRTYQRIQQTLAEYRYVTYVVDSEFVLLSDARPRSAADSLWNEVLDGLSPEDVECIIIRRSGNEAWKWRACEDVPVALVVTKSKRWRPRSLSSVKHER